jgi:hypothetical protein
MISLITVVFQEELSVLKMQAQSIDKFLDPELIDNIIVVINDEGSIFNVDPAWWGSLHNKVMVISRNIFATKYGPNGWHNQQLLKLLTAATCYNSWSLILDAKTIFIRHLDIKQQFDTQDKARVGTCMSIQPVFAESQNLVGDLFNIDLVEQLSPAGVPFFFHNITVRQLILQIEKTKNSFCDWFLSHPKLTEFLLYSGFVLHQYKSYDVLYNTKTCNIRAVNIGHSEVAQVKAKFYDMGESHTATVSIHRHAWQQMTVEQQQYYRDFLTQKGISCEL